MAARHSPALSLQGASSQEGAPCFFASTVNERIPIIGTGYTQATDSRPGGRATLIIFWLTGLRSVRAGALTRDVAHLNLQADGLALFIGGFD